MDVREQEPAFLIAAARRAVARSSIRKVAIQVGVSHGCMWNLVAGKTHLMYGPTIDKLRTWYLREWADGADGLAVEAAWYLLQQLLASINEQERRGAGLELLDALERIYRRCGAPPPVWFGALRDACRNASSPRPIERDKELSASTRRTAVTQGAYGAEGWQSP
jgi:hypothetical protein